MFTKQNPNLILQVEYKIYEIVWIWAKKHITQFSFALCQIFFEFSLISILFCRTLQFEQTAGTKSQIKCSTESSGPRCLQTRPTRIKICARYEGKTTVGKPWQHIPSWGNEAVCSKSSRNQSWSWIIGKNTWWSVKMSKLWNTKNTLVDIRKWRAEKPKRLKITTAIIHTCYLVLMRCFCLIRPTWLEFFFWIKIFSSSENWLIYLKNV